MTALAGDTEFGQVTNRWGCAIGGDNYRNAGNIVINSGTITAIGGAHSAGIGSYATKSCGNITINGGTVTASTGVYGAAIGCGYDGGSCGNILIRNTVTQVTATRAEDSPSAIGKGWNSASCGTITIEDGANVIQN